MKNPFEHEELTKKESKSVLKIISAPIVGVVLIMIVQIFTQNINIVITLASIIGVLIVIFMVLGFKELSNTHHEKKITSRKDLKK